MGSIERYDVNEQWAHSGIVKAGDFCFLNYCASNGGTIDEQILQALKGKDRSQEKLIDAVRWCMKKGANRA